MELRMGGLIKGTAAGAALVFVLACGNADAAKLPKDANTTCPVMVEEEVNPKMYVDFEGQRVYMCCAKCKRRFNRNPERYLARLVKADDAATSGSKANVAGKKTAAIETNQQY